MFNLENLERLNYSNKQIKKMLRVYESIGKNNYYKAFFSKSLKHISKKTSEDDTVYIAKIMGLDVSDFRLKMIVEKDSEPKTNDEQILANIKGITDLITTKGEKFNLTSNELLYINKRIYNKVNEPKFLFKDNKKSHLIVNINKESKRKDIDALIKKYENLIRDDVYESTQIITNFYIDFLTINPFNFGNKITGLITICVLLFEQKFSFFKYVSFFKLLYSQLSEFDLAVTKALYDSETGFSKTEDLNNLLLDLILKAYQRIEKMISEADLDAKVNKSVFVENTIMKLPEVFTKQQIREKHPLVSEATIDRTLKKMKDEGLIIPNNVGRSATWLKVMDNDNRLNDKINETYQQIRIQDYIEEALADD